MAPTILDNFHLITHFPFWGKVLEKVAVQQLQRTLDKVNYLNQSGFRIGLAADIVLVALLVDLW